MCLLLFEHLENVAERKEICFQINFGFRRFFLRDKGINVAMCLLSVPVLLIFFFFPRIKPVYKHWKDMLKMCRVSASILNCLSLSQAQKMVILYFLIYKGQGKNLWENSSCGVATHLLPLH